METQFHLRVSLVAAAMCIVASVGVARAQEQRPLPWPSSEYSAWPTSPFHGVTDGDGQTIPCRCRFDGRSYRLGETVCMSTHLGIVLTRCDLLLNNTSWVPTETACTISLGPARSTRAIAAVTRAMGPRSDR